MTPFAITSIIIATAYARIEDRKAGKIGASTNLELELAKTIEQIGNFSQDEFFSQVVNFENLLLVGNKVGVSLLKSLTESRK